MLFWLLAVVIVPGSLGNDKVCTTPELHDEHPHLCDMLDRLSHDGESVAMEINAWARANSLLIDFAELTKKEQYQHDNNNGRGDDNSGRLPVVMAHGMGDSCFNSGMQNIVEHTGSLLGVYSTCIPTGKDQREDTNNGYFLNMDASVDVFAEAVRKDEKLKDGFHAVGFSQGNNVIRGYIARYNEPAVDSFLSINGVNGGVGAVPYCEPTRRVDSNHTGIDSLGTLGHFGGICDMLMEQASRKAYTEWSQEHLFQANYWRDPRPVERESYRKYSQLAQWGNEGLAFNQTLKDNWNKTKQFVWILATEDGMVWPREGEQWGAPDPQDPFHHILGMNETEWFINDLFGLKTAQENGKNFFESFEGDHLQFTLDQYNQWVATYLSHSVTNKGNVVSAIRHSDVAAE